MSGRLLVCTILSTIVGIHRKQDSIRLATIINSLKTAHNKRLTLAASRFSSSNPKLIWYTEKVNRHESDCMSVFVTVFERKVHHVALPRSPVSFSHLARCIIPGSRDVSCFSGFRCIINQGIRNNYICRESSIWGKCESKM